MGRFSDWADSLATIIDRGRPGMLALGRTRAEISPNNIIADHARALDALNAGMDFIVAAFRAMDDEEAPPVPEKPDIDVERLTRNVVYAVWPTTYGDSVDVWWSTVPDADKARFRAAVVNALDRTVNQT